MASYANTEYEQLVQEIFQAINRQQEATTVEVEHDKKLLGRSECKHQVDVYWKFTMMGVTHQVAVECKNYSGENTIEIGRLRDFFGVLHDVGNIGGVFATTIGYQRGAKKFADYYGISLFEVRPPTDQDWAGRVRTIDVTPTLIQNQVTDREIKYDLPWLFQNTTYQENSKIVLKGLEDSIKIYDKHGKEITNFIRMYEELPFEYKEAVGLTYEYSFEEAYLEAPNGEKLKITGVVMTYDTIAISSSAFISGDEVVKAIVKDVKTGQMNMYDRDGRIRDIGSV